MTRIALLQMDCVEGERETNIEVVRDAAQEARRQGADVLALPELWSSGYDLAQASKQQWGDRELECLQELSSDDELAVLGGSILEPGQDRYRNAAVAFCRGVEAPRYRKLHLFAPLKEDRYLAPGSDAPQVFSFAGVRCGTTICYDLRFPEVYRPLATAGVELLYVPAQWPRPRIQHWRTLLIARAIENQCFVLGVNRVGTFGASDFPGHSLLVDPGGEVLLDPEEQRGLFCADIDIDRVAKRRRDFPVLRDRRSDLYPFLDSETAPGGTP